jgi:leukotriene-A4 hydrolase
MLIVPHIPFYMKKLIIVFSFLLGLQLSCKTPAEKIVPFNEAMQTFSNYDSVTCTHLDWKATVLFDKKIIQGKAIWHFINKTQSTELRLDIADLKINSVLVNQQPVSYSRSAHPSDPRFGEGIAIPIQPNDSIVEIDYETGAQATAIQWLEPSQTAGKKLPYLFTQCESIYARSLVPCQDVPANRITYNAEIHTPNDMMAVMSAKNPKEKNTQGVYSFEMEIPIPTYLIALAVGDIEYRAIDARTGVYTEPSLLDGAAKELSDIPAMMQAAEELGGPYRWGNYDVLIAPPSFPIGGMENPRLTFATPTILAGDKSLVSLIAHEMAHSWSGNLVTNATWNDLWLNEGFTTYFERRIMEKISGKSYNDMLWHLGYQDLESDIKDTAVVPRPDTRLRIELGKRHPEDAFTNIPYEKGAVFLRAIEEVVGRTQFDKFLSTYFQSHAFQTMTTEKALQYMDETLFKDHPEWKASIGISNWVLGEGIPTSYTHKMPERFISVNTQVEKWKKDGTVLADRTTTWTTHEWLHFLRSLPHPAQMNKLAQLDSQFHFTQTTNSEIAAEWYRLGIQSNYAAIKPQLEKFLSSVGRKKFLTPLYADMIAQPEWKIYAEDMLKKYKANYHPQTARKMESLFE